MIELGQRLGFAGEAFGKRGIPADAGRKNLQGHNAVQLLLPGLIDRAHAALADEFQNFQLGKLRAQLLRFGRDEARRLFRRVGVGAGGKRAFHQAFGAEALGALGGSGWPQLGQSGVVSMT